MDEKNEMTECPVCGVHCPTDALHCGRGRDYFARKAAAASAPAEVGKGKRTLADLLKRQPDARAADGAAGHKR